MSQMYQPLATVTNKHGIVSPKPSINPFTTVVHGLEMDLKVAKEESL